MKYFIYYLILVNIFAIAMMFIDKKKARKHVWRVPERNLFLTAILLGGAGIWAGMYIFRHKTKHLKFVVGIPIITFAEIYLLYRYVL